jgi:hypothetical protein
MVLMNDNLYWGWLFWESHYFIFYHIYFPSIASSNSS